MMRSTPLRARLRAVLRPRPRLPPVTRAIFVADLAAFSVLMRVSGELLGRMIGLADPTAEYRKQGIICLILQHGLGRIWRDHYDGVRCRRLENVRAAGPCPQPIHRRPRWGRRGLTHARCRTDA